MEMMHGVRGEYDFTFVLNYFFYDLTYVNLKTSIF